MKVKYLLLSVVLVLMGIGAKFWLTDRDPEPVEQPTAQRVQTLYISNEHGVDGEHFYQGHMSVLDVEKLRLSDDSFSAMTLAELVGDREYDRVVIRLGSKGEIGELIDAYWSLVILLIRTQPQAEILLYGTDRPGLNEAMQDMVDGYRVFYVENGRDTYEI